MTNKVFYKTPTETMDYDVSFEQWLDDGDTIDTASAAVTNTGGDVTIDSTVFDDDTAKVWLSGGTAGTSSEITVTVTTTGGRTKQRCFTLEIEEC